MTSDQDTTYLRRAIELSWQARERGNRPFGAVIALPDGTVLSEAFNRTTESRDCTTHAETEAIRIAGPTHGRDVMAQATMYASGEPCVMCSGAIFFSNIRRVVFGVDAERVRVFRQVAEKLQDAEMSCRTVFATSPFPIEVVGPMLLAEAIAPHEDFWKA